MSAYRKILVAVDGSSAATRGLREAVRLAKAQGAQLCILQVVNEFHAYAVMEGAGLGADLPAILRIAEASRRVEAVERDRYYSRTALEAFTRAVQEAGAGGEVTVGRLREALGLSRKFLIPLLEWSDRQGLTVRSGDTRRLRAPQGRPGRQP